MGKTRRLGRNKCMPAQILSGNTTHYPDTWSRRSNKPHAAAFFDVELLDSLTSVHDMSCVVDTHFCGSTNILNIVITNTSLIK